MTEGRFNIKGLRAAAESSVDNQIDAKPDNQIASQPDVQEEEKRVNLCVKVPISWRKHWSIQAKIEEVTMTEIMVQALTERFGLPDSQIPK